VTWRNLQRDGLRDISHGEKQDQMKTQREGPGVETGDGGRGANRYQRMMGGMRGAAERLEDGEDEYDIFVMTLGGVDLVVSGCCMQSRVIVDGVSGEGVALCQQSR
jgi:hypothetical protein